MESAPSGELVERSAGVNRAHVVSIPSNIDRSLAAGDALTPAELARKTGTHERYIREWLASQAASGFVTYDAELGDTLVPEYIADDFDRSNFILFSLNVTAPTANAVTSIPATLNNITRYDASNAVTTRSLRLTLPPVSWAAVSLTAASRP